MKKLKLDLKNLKIYSFDTESTLKKNAGTVNGNGPETNYTTCCADTLYDYTCDGWTRCPNLPC